MKEFLKKIKLLEEFTINLNIDKNKFATAFRNQVEEKDIDSFFSGAFEAFSSNEKLYKGFVNFNEFKVREKRKFGNRRFGNIKANGKFIQSGEKLKITTQINGWNNFLLFYFIITSIFYVFFLSFFLSDIISHNSKSLLFTPFILIHAIFMFGLPLFQIRKGVKSLKQNLEREFHFVVSKIIHS